MNIWKSIRFLIVSTLTISALHFSTQVIYAEGNDGDEEPVSPNTDTEVQALEVTEEEDQVLNLGDEDPSVVELKENLMNLGFAEFDELNEVYNEKTEEAVKSFQSHFGLEVSGELDDNTAAKMEEILTSSLQNGERHENAVVLKERLTVLGYWDSPNPTTLYGSQTEAAVESFQQDQQLPVSGIVDEITWSLIKELASEPLRNPMYREDAIDLKEKLETAGFGSFAKTNYFGPKTESVLKDFQSYYGLSSDGVAGENTLAKLDEIANSPFRSGERHQDTIKLKEYLTVLGYWDSSNPTTLYASKTEAAVREFQADQGLKVSGIAEEKTWDKLNSLATAPLQNPMYRQDVVPLKEKLELLGFGSFSLTDYFGPQTEQAVKDFQKYYGLSVDGIAGESTINKLNSEASTPFQNGERDSETVQLKEYLHTLGFWESESGTTLYASQTEQAVKEFQQAFGLRVSGVADSKTWTKLEEEATGPLKNPMYREDAITLKEGLERLGFGSFALTDYFGPQTEKTVRNFQSHYGLTVNGIANEQTLNKINELLDSPFQNGERHEDTEKLKDMLYTLGFWEDKDGTTYYGSQTEAAVKEFQSAFKLPESGIADSITWNKLESEATGPLKNPMYRDDAVTLKEDLETIGFGSFKLTDYYGPQTEKTLKEFQKYYGLSANGVANDATLSKIDEVLNSPFQNGERHEDTVKLKEKLHTLGFWDNETGTTLFGSKTEAAVKDFQEHYGLAVNGIADSVTWDKIEEILNSPFQNGGYHSKVPKYKEILEELGYGKFGGTDYFGPKTEESVKQFQADFGLPVTGILDEVTIAVLEQIEGRRISRETHYDVTLNEQLKKQMSLGTPPQTDRYANSPAYIKTSNLTFYTGGSITGSGVHLRTEPDTSSESNIADKVGNGTTFEYIKDVNGTSVGGNSIWYKIKYKGETLYVHSSLATKDGTIAKVSSTSNVYESKSTNSHIFYEISKGTEVSVVSRGSTWTEFRGKGWRNAKSREVLEYLDPGKQDDFQHLVLSESVNLPGSEIDKVLQGKGVLNGEGDAFVKAAQTYNVNEIYLISHALLETGHGTSDLAEGIKVGKNKNGNPVLVTSSNESSLTDVETVYNMFGIGAADSDAKRLGAIKAYKEEWFTVEKAIVGGAKFIGEDYIHNQYQQNTIYKMRWNPANPGYPQYATDMAWAAKQITNMKSMYSKLNNPLMVFDVPVYK
ncbi:peptidoglycan-binding protein [Gracilibacillus lacisalsi]|uniref:peptidoglycan-binding protein n=1 Tax=Gracilibacillus lacisalsi TaxID=393087 RepID=UPI0003601A6B|nr:peptidoglycan-binding protein [Gracilibacillus lacisalsi]